MILLKYCLIVAALVFSGCKSITITREGSMRVDCDGETKYLYILHNDVWHEIGKYRQTMEDCK